ncbi:MAG: hypothetical protein HKN09_09355 [Saprospiraceae bacterium]|nr:hypothetical protein [Saprospiraceae bacterium]
MKSFVSFIYLLLISSNLFGQFSSEISVFQGNSTCGCDIYLYTIVSPAPLTYTTPGPHTTTGGENVIGDLDEFVDENCERSVYVKVREYDSGQIKYYYDEMVNDVNMLLSRYRYYSTICFEGVFEFRHIPVRYAQNIKLLGYTRFNYVGDGSRSGISFYGNASSIEGGEITTSVEMNEGLINIHSEGSTLSNRFSNQIKNTQLVQTGNHILPSGQGSKQDRAIVMTNTFESLSTHRDNGSNYFTNIANVDIVGFGVGMHLRGWSNAALIRNISFSDISGYGLWISGCVDNSYTNLIFNNSSSASAIRLDNYVDERYQNYMIGGQSINLSDPNLRAKILTQHQLSGLLSSANSQTEFNNNLIALRNQNLDAPSYFALLEACGLPGSFNEEVGESPFMNVESEDDNGNLIVTKFGLFGYADDELPGQNGFDYYANYRPDNLDATLVNNDPLSSVINFYNLEYHHPNDDPAVAPKVFEDPYFLEEPTCLESSGLTSFFRRPAFNAFAGVNLYDDNGQIQVANAVEIHGREDGGVHCQKETEDPSSNCNSCYYDINGSNRFVGGLMNSIHLCNVPANVLPGDLINDVLNCGLINNASSNPKPSLTVTIH